jgi:hypothetical protein
MGSKPITQRAGTRYGSASANQEPEGTTPAKFARMSPIKSDGYRPALVMGAGQATQRTIPGGTTQQKVLQEVKTPKEYVGAENDACSAEYIAKHGDAACKQYKALSDEEKDAANFNIETVETIETVNKPDQKIEIKGEDWEGNLEREVMGDVRRSNAARKDRRGLTQFRPQAAKDARKSWKFADDKQRKQLLLDAGLDDNASRRDYIKAKKFEAQQKITKGHQALLDTQLTGAVRGNAPGSKTFLRTENLPFASLSRADQEKQLRAQAERNAIARTEKANNSSNDNTSSSSAVDSARAQYNSNMAAFYAEAENAGKRTPTGMPKKGNVNRGYKMGGYGTKNK